MVGYSIGKLGLSRRQKIKSEGCLGCFIGDLIDPEGSVPGGEDHAYVFNLIVVAEFEVYEIVL